MPVIRWHGWAAKCGACGKFVELCDGVLAYDERADVVDAILPESEKVLFRSQEEAIVSLCGCGGSTKRKRGKIVNQNSRET